MTNLEGYFAAGDASLAAYYHYHTAATGRYAGRKAAIYAKKTHRLGVKPFPLLSDCDGGEGRPALIFAYPDRCHWMPNLF